MSSLAEISQRFSQFKEIRSIMTAMKSLSLVETRKLARFIDHQHRMLANIKAAAEDFMHFFPVEGITGAPHTILLIIGSERGFCGNFNERVLAALHELPAWQYPPELVIVGHRLGSKLETSSEKATGVIASLEGPTVTEDVPVVLERMMDALHKASCLSADGVELFGLAHDVDGKPRLRLLLPLPSTSTTRFTSAPQIQLVPPVFFAELLDQYLLATLYGLIYESFAVENHQRLAHMENALDRLDEKLDGLALKRNALRQEKIIEEIEVTLSIEQVFANGSSL